MYIVSTKMSELNKMYASTAEMWRVQREEIEMNERIEAELAIQRSIKKQKQKEEEDFIRMRSPFKTQAPKQVVQETYTEPVKEKDEWTLVQRIKKKPKNNFNFNEVPEDMPIERELYADDDSH
jgi:hypothetical protein